MRRLLKFLHTIGAIGLMGSIACLLVLIRFQPPPTALAEYAMMHREMADIGRWIFFPSLALTLLSGLLAIAVTHAFHNAGWAWVKLATGVLMFEGGLVDALGPIQAEAKRSADALAGSLDPAKITGSYGAEYSTLWMLLAISAVNVGLGIWRPRLTRIPD